MLGEGFGGEGALTAIARAQEPMWDNALREAGARLDRLTQ
jgi:hypothetical protein